MRGTSWWMAMAAVVAVVGACGAGDTRVDPGDLELRDLLGLSPDVASAWNGDQREAARRVLVGGFEEKADPASVALTDTPSLDDRVARGLAVVDAKRVSDGASALGVVRIVIRSTQLTANPRPAEHAIGAAQGTAVPVTELWLAEDWDARTWNHLPGRGLDLLSAIAIDAGHVDGPVIVVPAPRLAAIAGYVEADGDKPARLIVNPIVLAALEPEPMEAATAALLDRAAVDGTSHARIAPAGDTHVETKAVASGNPYSFYGSVSECAYVQRSRCESCLPASNCTAVTSSTGNEECTALSAANGRGYFLLCANLAIAITSVERCVEDREPGCGRDIDAASELNELENNANFIDDAACGTALDACLADIYGAPGGQFPGPGPDGGTGTPSEPPRSTSVDCGDSCNSDNNSNCEASPSCNCEGPSCNNSLSCDSACASSNDQSGCGGNCDSCSSDDGTSSGGGGSCSSEDGGGTGGSSCGGSDSGGSCGGDSGGSCGGDSCGGSGGSCGGDGGCGSSGGGCGGGSGGGGCSGGGGSGGSCNVTKRDSSGGIALAISLIWAFMPVPVAAVIRRRSKRRKAAAEEVAS